MVPYELLQDLNKLVCSSKNKKVEDLFIKLAAEAETEHANGSDFYKWLLKNINNKDLENKVSDPETLKALSYLAKNKDKLNDSPNYLLFSQYAKYADVCFGLMALARQNPDQYGKFLTPFDSFFGALKHWEPNDTSSDYIETLNKDLSTVFNEYEAYLNHPDHHYMLPHERGRGRGEDDTKRYVYLRTKIYRHLFGYLLYNFTESILAAINKTTHGAWDKTKQLLEAKRLPRYGEIMGSLPYIPRMGDAGPKIDKLFRSLPDIQQKYGDTETYNIVNRKVLSALERPVPYSTTPQQETNYGDWYSRGRNPGSIHDHVDDVEEAPEVQEESHHVELPYEEVLECSYILCISALLGKIQERIQKSTELEYQ